MMIAILVNDRRFVVVRANQLCSSNNLTCVFARGVCYFIHMYARMERQQLEAMRQNSQSNFQRDDVRNDLNRN